MTIAGPTAPPAPLSPWAARAPLHQLRRRFPRHGSFIHRRRKHHKRQPGITQNFGAANRSGGKNQLHNEVMPASILQRDAKTMYLAQMTTDSWNSPKA